MRKIGLIGVALFFACSTSARPTMFSASDLKGLTVIRVLVEPMEPEAERDA